MLDFVLWSFAMVLVPVALGLAWTLISRIADWIGLSLAQALKSAEKPRPLVL